MAEHPTQTSFNKKVQLIGLHTRNRRIENSLRHRQKRGTLGRGSYFQTLPPSVLLSVGTFLRQAQPMQWKIVTGSSQLTFGLFPNPVEEFWITTGTFWGSILAHLNHVPTLVEFLATPIRYCECRIYLEL